MSGCVLPYGEGRAWAQEDKGGGPGFAQPGGCPYVSMHPANGEMKGEQEIARHEPFSMIC